MPSEQVYRDVRPLPVPRADPVDRHVGRRLRGLRESRGLSQDDLARWLNTDVGCVERFEQGIDRAGAFVLSRLAARLGVSVTFFFEGMADTGGTAGPGGTAAGPPADHDGGRDTGHDTNDDTNDDTGHDTDL